MNNLDQIIDNYLQSEERYALQIDGEWGVGKTYFIQNNVIERLKEHNYPIYFSVYGHNNLNDLKQELFYQIIYVLNQGKNILSPINSVNKKFKKISGILGDSKLKSIGLVSDWILESYSNSKINSSKEGKRIIIFIDDLERLSQNIALKDLLGFILNELLEKLRSKVVILSNNSEISEEDDFRKIKEKVISRTVNFKYDMLSVEKMILKKSKNKFIQDNSSWITIILENQQISNGNKGINMRTLFSIIENFDFIDSKLIESIDSLESDKLKVQLRKSVFLNVFVITSEYKLGNIDYNSFELLKGLTNTRSFFYYVAKDETKTIKEKIIDQYHNQCDEFDNHIFYSNDINSYLLLGYIMEINYIENWKKVNFPETKELDNLAKLWNFRRLTDEDLKLVQNDIFMDIKQDKFDFSSLLNIYGQFNQFEKMDLIFLDNDYSKTIESKLKAQYSSSDPDGHSDLASEIFKSSFSNIKQEKPKLFEQFKLIENQRNIDKTKYFIECLFNEKDEEIINMKQSGFLSSNNIFRAMLEGEVIDKYIVLDNNKADILWQFINSEYLRISNAKDFHAKEIDDINLFLKDVINKLEQADLGRIDYFKIKQLIESLEKLLVHLK
ncbi:hypothetical protein CKN73_09150 [Carnobacterium divergens]|uniref:P-loop NTPase fold protein n=1 Tax=Carnobacterium divergens TaxID=2748 RepID=UPI001072A7DD|nr:P-loop NTPase fold protein [Carnobacterium divergens]TFJ40468.1 hypothetical protein CKN77_09250 [Carnobacterium divergens]TFJ49088.1 hypothetical protein CKN73_09150 [Carnobacterium divergens]TFJ54352.1 hypothetical protein CKN83_09055 [Carnobacterium divergens]TFJ59878.1 hypothetical protein CKN89_09495 [Carnobacterium divergens]TFJ70522.1 hypothetical protein CKN91_09110 [Carnobacterium divergens]